MSQEVIIITVQALTESYRSIQKKDSTPDQDSDSNPDTWKPPQLVYEEIRQHTITSKL